MIDAALFIIFIILPFFRAFNGNLLQNIHNIIAVVGIGGVILGIILNKLDEYLDNLLKYLVPVLISTIAVHFFLKTYDSAQIKITLLELGGPLILILWIIKRVNLGNFKIAPSRKYVLYPALLFILSGIVSFILSPFHLETFEPGLLRRISYLGVFLVTVFEFNHEEDFKRNINWVLATCFLVVVYGFVQYLGYDWHIWKGAFGSRIFSTFGNPNFYAAWLVLVLPLILTKILMTNSPNRKLAFTVFAGSILYMIRVTSTKGSWVGLAVVISVFAILATLYLIKGNPRVLKKIAVAIIAATILIAGVGITWFSVKRINSIRFRLFTWGATMKMITEPIFVHPLKSFVLGHGIETFKLVYPTYRRPEIFLIEGKHNTETDHAHNEFLEIIYDEGIVGLAIFLWLLAGIYYMALRRLSLLGMGGAKSGDEFYIVGLIAGTIGMLAHSAVSVHVRFVSSGYILWTFLGFLVVHTAPVMQKKDNTRKLISVPKLLIIAVLLVVAGMSSYYAAGRFRANIYHNRAIAYSKQRMWKQALEFYWKVQKNHPSFIMSYYFEGNVYNDKLTGAIKAKNETEIQLNYKKAVSAYKKVLSMYPNYVQVHFQMGMMHLKVNNIDEAKKSFRKYLNIVDPIYPFTFYRLGMIKAKEKDLDKAAWYMEEPAKRIPKNKKKMIIEAYMNLASVHTMQNKPVKAEKAYKNALELNKNDVNVLMRLADLYARWKKRTNAIEVYEKILKLNPGNKKIQQKLKSLKS